MYAGEKRERDRKKGEGEEKRENVREKESTTQRLRALYVAVPMCGGTTARRVNARGWRWTTTTTPCTDHVYVHPRQRGRRNGEGGKIHLATSFIFIP